MGNSLLTITSHPLKKAAVVGIWAVVELPTHLCQFPCLGEHSNGTSHGLHQHRITLQRRELEEFGQTLADLVDFGGIPHFEEAGIGRQPWTIVGMILCKRKGETARYYARRQVME